MIASMGIEDLINSFNKMTISHSQSDPSVDRITELFAGMTLSPSEPETNTNEPAQTEEEEVTTTTSSSMDCLTKLFAGMTLSSSEPETNTNEPAQTEEEEVATTTSPSMDRLTELFARMNLSSSEPKNEESAMEMEVTEESVIQMEFEVTESSINTKDDMNRLFLISRCIVAFNNLAISTPMDIDDQDVGDTTPLSSLAGLCSVPLVAVQA